MQQLFIKVLNLSIWAGWIVLGILILRLILKTMPKWLHCLLWIMVAIRLMIPDSVESSVSVIPSKETVPETIVVDQKPAIHTGLRFLNLYVNPILQENLAPNQEIDFDNDEQRNEKSDNVLDNELLNHSVDSEKVDTNISLFEEPKEETPIGKIVFCASVVWILGMILMSIYSLVSYFTLRYRVKTAVRLRDNIWQSEQVDSSFILGVIKPKIYLPYQIDDTSMQYIVAHEQAHIKRKDYLIKPFAFFLLTIYWFQPLLWVAYIYLCRDIEFACDEKVIRSYGIAERKEYSKVLVASSVNRRWITVCPLAFGEIGVKERIKSVMYYKKPTLLATIIAVLSCVIAGVCLLTGPEQERQEKGKQEVVVKEEDKPSSLYSDYEMLAMIHEIMDDKGKPELAFLSFTTPLYIEENQEVYQKLVDNGQATVNFFTDFLRYTKRGGLAESIMVSICEEITGFKNSSSIYTSSDWIEAYDEKQQIEKVEMNKIGFNANSIGLEQLSDVGKTALFGSTMKADLSRLAKLSYLPIIKINSYKELEQFNQQLSNYSDLTKSAHGTESYLTMTEKYDEQYFENQALFMVYMPIVDYDAAPFIQSVKRSSDGKGLVVRVDIDGEREGIEEERSWFLAVEIEKEQIEFCRFMTALVNIRNSKTYYYNSEDEEANDTWEASLKINVYNSGFSFSSKYASDSGGYYEKTDDTLTLHFAKKTSRDKGGYKLVFQIEGNRYILDAKRSTKIPEEYVASTGEVKSEISMPDGAIFEEREY